jgi:hypothetical protein
MYYKFIKIFIYKDLNQTINFIQKRLKLKMIIKFITYPISLSILSLDLLNLKKSK